MGWVFYGVKVAKNDHRKSKQKKTVSQVPRSSVKEGRVARTSVDCP